MRARRLLVALTAAALLATPAAAQDRTGSDIVDDLERTQREASEVERGLGLTETQIARARDELIALEDALAAARDRLALAEKQLVLAEEGLAEAQERAEAAARRVETAERLLRAAEAQLAAAERTLADQAAAAYKYGAGRNDWVLRVVRDAQDPGELASELYKLRSVVAYQDAIVQHVTALREERDALLRDAEDARQLAEVREAEAAETLATVTRLRDEAVVIARSIARDEQRQREVLEELEADAAAKQQVLAELDERRATLEEELEAERARRRAAGEAPCPVVGARTGRDFTNDWGFPRSGHRTHEGTDVFADRGTPVVAMYDGTIKEIRRSDVGLGGLFVSYWVGPGEHWYNAHLDSIPPDLSVGDRVAPGTVIGTVGNSGNARTTPPHLHIGHYVDGRASNPYPLLADACR